MRIGDYEAGRLLGEGGMGRVYAATHVRLGEQVALKELSIEDPAMREQFLLEAKLLYNLRHPCFPTVKDYFEHRGRHYLVMDLIAGASLQSIIESETRVAETELQWMLDQILEGLAYLHAAGIVHRDIKPGNIMVEKVARRAVLVDFGIARGTARGVHTIAVARAAFTPHMAPPEQYRGELSTPATDLFQVGATAYYALTGVLPPESIGLRSDADLPDPRAHFASVSRNAAAIIVRAMSLLPAARHASAAAMRAQWLDAGTARNGPVTAVSARALDTFRQARSQDIRRRPI